jgi:hypothetical protein
MTWAKQSTATVAWAQVHPQPVVSDGGVDFELQFRKDGPVLFTNDRPLLFMSSISEGSP